MDANTIQQSTTPASQKYKICTYVDASTLRTEDASLPKVINDVKTIAIDMLSISDGCLQCGHNIIRTEDEECVECEKCGLL